jgi:catechol 2,3-dioxygenase-like lactoylglutathione lyase family enzyme
LSETADPRRLRITGLHHVTLLCADVDRSAAFYRDLLGMRLVERSRNPDDPNAEHLQFGGDGVTGGTMVTCMAYPDLEEGSVGRGSTHHFALAVESDDELAAWRDYLRSRGVDVTDVHDRGRFRSIYLRDPDGHLVEIATTWS